MSSTIPLSVVFATTQPWPEARATLDAVWQQANQCDAEVLLAVSGPHACPPEGAYPGLRTVTIPEASVFELRRKAIASSRGAVVAMTEDHCRPDSNWCAGMIAAHEKFPEADLIGGAIRNGACDPAGWAAFLLSNGPFLPPIAVGPCREPSGVANISYKRRALGERVGTLEEGFYREELRHKGAVFYSVGGVEVLHAQALPAWTLAALCFQGGRSMAGSQRDYASTRSWFVRLCVLLALPGRVAVHTPRLAIAAARRSQEYRAIAVRSLPWLAAFTTTYGLGQLLGHFFGVGRSKYYLR